MTAGNLVVVLSAFYRDACDVAPAGDDTMPWLPRLRRDIRRLSTGGPAGSSTTLGDDELDALIIEAWTVLRHILSMCEPGSESYWDRYFGRAYGASRIVDAAPDADWEAGLDTPFLAS